MKAHVNLTKDSTDFNRNVCVCVCTENGFDVWEFVHNFFSVFRSRLTNSQMPGMKQNKRRRRRNGNRTTGRENIYAYMYIPARNRRYCANTEFHTPVAMIVCVTLNSFRCFHWISSSSSLCPYTLVCSFCNSAKSANSFWASLSFTCFFSQLRLSFAWNRNRMIPSYLEYDVFLPRRRGNNEKEQVHTYTAGRSRDREKERRIWYHIKEK